MENVYFEPKQAVYDLRFGKGFVIEIDMRRAYPVGVEFDNDYINYYTIDGRYNDDGENVSLFQKPPTITPNVPLLTSNYS